MSAQMAGQANQPTNSFSAHLVLAAGVTAHIHAETLADLSTVVARLQDRAANEPAPKPASTTTAKAATPAPAASPAPSVGNASASTSTPAGAPPASGGSTSAGDEKRPTYDDVRERVLKLSKISRETAATLLAKFTGQNGQPCDHANKMKLEDYPTFIDQADKILSGGKP